MKEGKFGDPAFELSLAKKMELVATLEPAMEASESKMQNIFDAELEKHEFANRDQLLEAIEKVAEESAKIFVEMISTNEKVRELLGNKIDEYIAQRKEGARMAAILQIIFKNSVILLDLYTNGRRDLEETEIIGIARTAATEIAQKLKIPQKWIERLKENLVTGMTDPNNLAHY